MLIRCPECDFERELDPSKIPDSAVMATCPRCDNRFRFREKPQPSDAAPQETAPETGATAPEGDDPLPPGAITPPVAPSRETSDAYRRNTEAEDGADGGNDDSRDKEAQFAEYMRHAREGEKEDRGERDRNRSLFSGGGASDIPWENAEPAQLPIALYHTLLRALFSVPAFFTAVGASRASLLRPCLFGVLLGLFQSLMLRFWNIAFIREQMASIQDPQTLAALDSVIQQMTVTLLMVVVPPLQLMQLLFFSALLHLMIRLTQPDAADFATTLRVVAYCTAPYIFFALPAQYLLIPGTRLHLITIWVAVCCFMGVKYAHRLDWTKAAMATLPLYVLGVLISMNLATMTISGFTE